MWKISGPNITLPRFIYRWFPIYQNLKDRSALMGKSSRTYSFGGPAFGVSLEFTLERAGGQKTKEAK